MTRIDDRRADGSEIAPAAGRRRPPVAARRVPILMYHEITDEPLSTGHLAVAPQDFAQQLGYLRSAGYTAIRATDLVTAMTGRGLGLPAKPVVITFDDGFADFYDDALPALRHHEFTATLFATTRWIRDAGERASGADGAGRVPPGMLSWSQLREAAASGIEIGAHSQWHPELDQLPVTSLCSELQGSKDMLEDRLGIAVAGLAYPYGYSNQLVRDRAADAGYQYGCAVGNRLARKSDDLFALPRLTIARATRLSRFGQIVAGERLAPELLAYRALTRGWSVVRRSRSALRRVVGE